MPCAVGETGDCWLYFNETGLCWGGTCVRLHTRESSRVTATGLQSGTTEYSYRSRRTHHSWLQIHLALSRLDFPLANSARAFATTTMKRVRAYGSSSAT